MENNYFYNLPIDLQNLIYKKIHKNNLQNIHSQLIVFFNEYRDALTDYASDFENYEYYLDTYGNILLRYITEDEPTIFDVMFSQ